MEASLSRRWRQAARGKRAKFARMARRIPSRDLSCHPVKDCQDPDLSPPRDLCLSIPQRDNATCPAADSADASAEPASTQSPGSPPMRDCSGSPVCPPQSDEGIFLRKQAWWRDEWVDEQKGLSKERKAELLQNICNVYGDEEKLLQELHSLTDIDKALLQELVRDLRAVEQRMRDMPLMTTETAQAAEMARAAQTKKPPKVKEKTAARLPLRTRRPASSMRRMRRRHGKDTRAWNRAAKYPAKLPQKESSNADRKCSASQPPPQQHEFSKHQRYHQRR